MEQNLQQFHDHVNSPRVWEAEHDNHARWITDLCVALLQSGAVTDSVLSLLQPVCQMKVGVKSSFRIIFLSKVVESL